MSTTDFVSEAARTIRDAQFRVAWPLDVRKTLVKAANTEGDLPPFAVKQVEWALRTARAIERRMAADIRKAEALAPRHLPPMPKAKVTA